MHVHHSPHHIRAFRIEFSSLHHNRIFQRCPEGVIHLGFFAAQLVDHADPKGSTSRDLQALLLC